MVAGPAELPSDGFPDTQLLKRRGPVVQPDFLGDFAVLDAQDGGSRKVHLPARRRRERADEEISESGSGVRTAALPSAHDIITLGDEIGGAPEVQVRERGPETLHEVPHVLATPTRRV